MKRFTITSVNEFLKVNNRFGEYIIFDNMTDCIIVEGLTYEQAEMEVRMLEGKIVSFEEYKKVME